MSRLISWGILTGVFLLAGYGLNLIRIAVVDKLADPTMSVGLRALAGLILMAAGVSFLGGFIYYRLKKRGKIKKPDWLNE